MPSDLRLLPGRARHLVVAGALLLLVLGAHAPSAAPQLVASEAMVTLTAPRPSAYVRGAVQVTVAADPTIEAVTVEASRDRGATWALVGTDAFPADGFSVVWDTRPWSGDILLRAVSAVGLSTSVGVHVDNEAPVGTVAVSRRFVGRGPQNGLVRVTVQASEPVRVQVRAVRDGRPGVLITGSQKPARRFGLAWRPGTPAASVPDGRYRLDATILDRAGNTARAGARVVVDRRPPSVTGIRARLVEGRLVIRARIEDAAAVRSVDARIRHLNTGVEARLVEQAGDSRTWLVDWRPPERRSLGAGLYAVSITPEDAAGNAGEPTRRHILVNRPTRTEVVARVLGAGPKVALTFDDCVYGAAWRRILSTLADRHVRAAFFCTGKNVTAMPGLALRTVVEGHVIGSHAREHVDLTELPDRAVRSRLADDHAVWWRSTRASPRPYFRPPYGSYDERTLAVAGSDGYSEAVLWDVDPEDWRSKGFREIADHVLSHTRPGSIVLLHVVPQTARALDTIVTGLRQRGLEPVGLDELFWAPSAIRTNAHWPRR